MQAVVHAMRSRHHEALAKAGVGLSPLEVRVLVYFARHPGATQRELADHSGRDKGQVDRLVRGLHERGLLEATDDPDDGRITRVHLSPAAQTLYQSVLRQRRRMANAVFEGIGNEERRRMLALLRRMHLNIESPLP